MTFTKFTMKRYHETKTVKPRFTVNLITVHVLDASLEFKDFLFSSELSQTGHQEKNNR